MKPIMLNDIIKLTDEQINNCKIGLNMSWDSWNDGKSKKVSGFEKWYNSDENKRDVGFTYHSHQAGRRNFTFIGQWLFGFVRLENHDHWLLVTAGEILDIPSKDNIGECKHRELDEYNSLLGRLIIKYHRGNKWGNYIFNMKEIIHEAEVLEILPNIYEPIKFTGFNNIHLEYKTLKIILNSSSGRYLDYKAALGGVRGIYCLTDSKESKFYIGSASGEKGILQRWEDYIETKAGGNVALIELYKKKGDKYFEDNFEFTLLEPFDKQTLRSKILERESYWKEVFKTRENGYNKN